MRDVRINGFADERWHEIIKGVDLELYRGQVMGLIGESGAGKSTLGLAAMGFARPGCQIVGGSIVFDQQDLRTMPLAQRRQLWGNRITYVAQSAAASFNPAHRLMAQTIETALRMKQDTAAKIRTHTIKLYQSLRLPDPEHIGMRYPHQVSGGQLQRVMTAMAMASRPDLIIFDEPTTALDVTTQVEVLAAMRDIVKTYDTAAIYITHDLAVVAQMADFIKVLRHGQEVEQANTRTMLTTPTQEYTRSLWSVRTLYKPAVKGGEEILSMRGVTAKYGQQLILHDIDIQLNRAQTVALVGESGSGKSTAARVITGLLPPSAGAVYFHDQILPATLKQRTPKQLQQIQMIYQMADTAVNPRQTVAEIIGRPLEFYLQPAPKAKQQRLSELMHMIELDESFLERFPAELSGGQKQRICIARALAAEPEIIICDEVTSALDQIVQEGILRLLMRLQQELGMAYLFITHDIATVRAIADQIVVMHQGRVVEQGLKDDVLTPPHPAYTQQLLSSVPEMDPDWLDQLLATKEQT